jgi:hypothetical protein
MIDSVVLKIKHFTLYTDEFFSKAKMQEFRGKFGIVGRHWTRYTEYPTKAKTEGRYFPQVNIMYDQRLIKGSGGKFTDEKHLLVQVSLPKLIYGISLFDVDHRFLPLIASKLRSTLAEIKIGVSEEAIMGAIVQRVDYSKILKIAPSYGSTAAIIRALSEHDRKQSSDFNKVNYHHGKDGFYLKFFNSSQGFVIYDKFEEICANGSTLVEREIKQHYAQGKFQRGALRMELSLQLKQTVEAALRKLYPGKKKDFTLGEALRTDISKALLLRTFEQIYIQGYGGLVYLGGLKDAELYNLIQANIKGFGQRGAVYLLAHRVRTFGLKNATNELRREIGKSSANRYRKLVEKVLLDAKASKNKVNVLAYLHQKLKAFTPVLPEDLDAMLGSVAASGTDV